MLPLEKAVASPRNSPTPPEPPTLGSEDAAQQGAPEAEPEAKAEAGDHAEAVAEVHEDVARVDAAVAEVHGHEVEVHADAAEVHADAAEVHAGAAEVPAGAEVGANVGEIDASATEVEIDAEVHANAAEVEVDADMAEADANTAEADADAAEADADAAKADADAAEADADAAEADADAAEADGEEAEADADAAEADGEEVEADAEEAEADAEEAEFDAEEAELDAELDAEEAEADADEAEADAEETELDAEEVEAEADAELDAEEAELDAEEAEAEADADEAEFDADAAEVDADAAEADDADAEITYEVCASAAEVDDDAEFDEDDPAMAEVDVETEAETGYERTPVDLEFSRLRFREFAYQEAAGPHQTLARLHELCRQWLRPESCSKEEILEMLVLEQFLGILPDRVRPWVVAQYPENCKKAASLVEGLSDVLDEPDMLLCSPGGSSSELSEGTYERPSGPLPPPALPSLLPAWPALESMLLEQGSVGAEKSREAGPARAELEKSKLFSEEPLPSGEWDHLDPAEENLQSYRKLLLWGYQQSQPGAVLSPETEEAGLEDLHLPGDSGPGDGKAGPCEGVSEEEARTDRAAEDTPRSPAEGVAHEHDGQPEKLPEDQGEEAFRPGTAPPLEVQNKGVAGPAGLQPGVGTKRPHPEDEAEAEAEGPGYATGSVGKELAAGGVGSPVEQAPGPSSAASPPVAEAGARLGQPYPCSECGEAFAWIAHLAEHLGSHSAHSSKKHRACPDC